jgi:formate hydrogenlyase subunit 4
VAILRAAALFLLAPFVQGLIQGLKARIQGRRGPGLLQPYFTLAKSWRRQDVRPAASSSVFVAAPRVVLGLVIAAACAVPLFGAVPGGWSGDFLVLVGLLAAERFVMGLAGLDQGTPFAGMGASRLAVVGTLVEPAFFALALPFATRSGSTAWGALLLASRDTPVAGAVRLFVAAAGLMVVLAETGRLPVDNPDTHLELTMIHEAVLLEYSGPQLAMLSLAQMARQLLVIAAVGDLLLPWSPAGVLAPVLAAGTWLTFAALLAVAESLSAKVRFFRLPSYLGTAAALSSAAAVLQVWGVR